MQTLIIDGLTIDQLRDRYGIGKTQLNTRRVRLGIEYEIQKGTKRAIASARQIALLDDLDQHLKTGRTIDEFCEERGISDLTIGLATDQNGELFDHISGLATVPTTDLTTDQNSEMSIAQGVALLADAIASRLVPQNSVSQLRDRINLLDELCDRAVPIPTGDVKMLLGRKSIGGSIVFAYGYRLTRTEGRQGGQSLWRIDRS